MSPETLFLYVLDGGIGLGLAILLFVLAKMAWRWKP
jgi:hypothetical protein